MEDDFRGETDKGVTHLRRPDIDLMEMDMPPSTSIRKAREHPGREVVDDEHLGSLVDEAVHQVRSDEAGSAGNQYFLHKIYI